MRWGEVRWDELLFHSSVKWLPNNSVKNFSLSGKFPLNPFAACFTWVLPTQMHLFLFSSLIISANICQNLYHRKMKLIIIIITMNRYTPNNNGSTREKRFIDKKFWIKDILSKLKQNGVYFKVWTKKWKGKGQSFRWPLDQLLSKNEQDKINAILKTKTKG